jgi:hypothetical protein
LGMTRRRSLTSSMISALRCNPGPVATSEEAEADARRPFLRPVLCLFDQRVARPQCGARGARADAGHCGGATESVLDGGDRHGRSGVYRRRAVPEARCEYVLSLPSSFDRHDMSPHRVTHLSPRTADGNPRPGGAFLITHAAPVDIGAAVRRSESHHLGGRDHARMWCLRRPSMAIHLHPEIDALGPFDSARLLGARTSTMVGSNGKGPAFGHRSASIISETLWPATKNAKGVHTRT